MIGFHTAALFFSTTDHASSSPLPFTFTVPRDSNAFFVLMGH
jgi:hypothetical protein